MSAAPEPDEALQIAQKWFNEQITCRDNLDLALIAGERASINSIATLLREQRAAGEQLRMEYFERFPDVRVRDAFEQGRKAGERAGYVRGVREALDEFRVLVCAPDELPEQYQALVEKWCIRQYDPVKDRIRALLPEGETP